MISDGNVEEPSTQPAAYFNGKKEYRLNPTAGPPVKMYPYVMVNGKPRELGSGAYSTVYEAVDKVRYKC
jgi:hypothetical protein